MPEQHNNGKERKEDQVIEIHSSDSYIARQLGEIRSEIEGTSTSETISGDVLKTKIVGVSMLSNKMGSESKFVKDPRNLPHDRSALGDYHLISRVRGKKARLKKAA